MWHSHYKIDYTPSQAEKRYYSEKEKEKEVVAKAEAEKADAEAKNKVQFIKDCEALGVTDLKFNAFNAARLKKTLAVFEGKKAPIETVQLYLKIELMGLRPDEEALDEILKQLNGNVSKGHRPWKTADNIKEYLLDNRE